ncbi:MAG: T9SS type A sorting domain-containing protein, partial [Paludibacteraceae bacterium]|nr:T9SS type A sorting domain-containing protein [Paludibacteraceae bacterium]
LYLPIYNEWRKIITINYNNYEKGVSNVLESKYNFWGGKTDTYISSDIPFLFNNEIEIRKAHRIELGYTTFVDTITDTSNPYQNHKNLVYPNPSDGIFYLDTRHYKIQSFKVSNLSGKVMIAQNQADGTGVIDLTDLPRGIYLLKIQTPDNQLVQKIIKK